MRRFWTLALIAVGAVALAPTSAGAVDMTLKGRFTCNDGQPLADMRVELMNTKTRLLPEIWPNQTVAAAGRTGPNGEWEWRVRGGESNWRVRAVLVNNDVGVKNFPTTWHHYHDTLRTQNNRPLADYGTQVVPGAECRLWAAFKAAADGYRADTGTSNPAGKVTVLDNAPTSGVPFTPYTDVFWPGNYAPIRNIGTPAMPVMRSVAQHEFAHSFRHQLDGDKGHFAFDSARFWYLRSHSGTSCAPTNHGFAFNEGWAEYWADEVRSTPCTNSQDFSIERNVAFELKRLQSTCVGVTRGRMVQVLAQNRGRIHSMSDFSNALGCQPRKVIRTTGKAKRPPSAVSALVTARVVAARALLAALSRDIAKSRAALPRTTGFAERALLRARIEQAQAQRATFAYLVSRAEQTRIARLSDKRQIDLLAIRQREYLKKARVISSTTLGTIADRLRRTGDRAGAKVIDRARAGAVAGRVDVLQVTGQPRDVTPQPGGPDTQTPTPTAPPVAPVGTPTPPAPTPVPKADLVVPLVVSLVYRPEPFGCTVNYRRGNVGTVASGASITSVQLSSPGQITLTNTIAAVPLPPGQTQQESILFPGINCDPDVFEVTATITADSTNTVDESDETNNTGTRMFGPG
jgi:hypothetical protein